MVLALCFVGATWAGEDQEGVYPQYVAQLLTSPSWMAEGDQLDCRFGLSVASAGDVNKDGYSDVIVGAPVYDVEVNDAGRAYVYHGGPSGLSPTPSWIAQSDRPHANFGHSVASAGDVNGDGYSDVVVGAWSYSNGQLDEGRAYVYHGGPSGLSGTPAWTVESDREDARFGYDVASAGDVNGDGYSDLIVGAWHHNTGQGRAYVYHGGPSGLSLTPSWIASGAGWYAYFGHDVASAGDVNGDGYSDVIVGAYITGYLGYAYVYHGGSLGLSTEASWIGIGDQSRCYFGSSVAGAGDVNNDGYSDVIVGAFVYDNGEIDEGRAYVYHGSSSGLPTTASWTAEADQIEARFGWSASSAGDVNADGYSDVVVGAHWYDNEHTDGGRAYVYCGGPSGVSPTAAWTAEGGREEANFGYSVASAGDVNADGYSDVIVGAYWDDGQFERAGRAYVYHGGEDAVPVEIIAFEAAALEEGILLSWSSTWTSGFGAFFIHRNTGVADGNYIVLNREAIEGEGIGARDYSYFDTDIVPGTLYYYRIEGIGSRAGGNVFFGPYPVMARGARAQCWLGQNTPNPFAQGTGTTICYSVSYACKAEIKIFDAVGRLVNTLVQNASPGNNSIFWDVRDGNGHPVPSGVYSYQIKADGLVSQKKMLLVQ
jgi:hypothetical protein